MIEQLKPLGIPAQAAAERKRISITEELLELADKQKELETERDRLKESMQAATGLLVPLRAQMQEVIACMKKFHEMENAYVTLSKQTYQDIAFDMNAIGKEIEQTKGLLLEGNRLAEAGIEIIPALAEEKAVEKAAEGNTQDVLTGAWNVQSVNAFWNAVEKACEQAEILSDPMPEHTSMMQITLTKQEVQLYLDLPDTVCQSDVDALRFTLQETDDTDTLTAELMMKDGSLQPAPVLGASCKEELTNVLKDYLRDYLRMKDCSREQAEPAAPDNIMLDSNFDGLLEELEVE